jgi:drug/metabolite transporter (DMT)-like permease
LRRIDPVPIVPLLSVRFAVSAVLLVVVLLISIRPLLPTRGKRWQTILLGTVYALESGLFFASLPYGSVAALTLLFFTYLAWVALLGVISRRDRPSGLLLASLLAAIADAGLVLSDVGSLSLSWLGATLALGSSLAAAIYLWTADMVLDSTESLTAALHICLGASVSFFVWELGSGDFPLDQIISNWPIVLGLGLLTGTVS